MEATLTIPIPTAAPDILPKRVSALSALVSPAARRVPVTVLPSCLAATRRRGNTSRMFSNPSLRRATASHAVNGSATVCIFQVARSQNADQNTEGSGHYVKMVHNGIEYGDMQLISEVSLEPNLNSEVVLTEAVGIRHHEAWTRPL
jgi:hypothetical protein